MSIRVGMIDYLNVQPFYYGLAERVHGEIEFVKGVPTALNRMLAKGEIDLAPISAIEAARDAEQYVILPNLSIASIGAVRTVLLFSWRPDPRELDSEPLALTDHSATSVALVKTLYRELYGVQPKYRVVPQVLPDMLRCAEAALIIGDDALVEGAAHRLLIDLEGRSTRPYIFDLGDEWLKLTGLSFVFALWTARRDRLDVIRSSGVVPALHASLAAGQAHIDDIACAYAPRLHLPAGVCSKYLRDLRYWLRPRDLEGLYRFLGSALPDFQPEHLLFLETEARGG